jgi:hypothetical protein
MALNGLKKPWIGLVDIGRILWKAFRKRLVMNGFGQ